MRILLRFQTRCFDGSSKRRKAAICLRTDAIPVEMIRSVFQRMAEIANCKVSHDDPNIIAAISGTCRLLTPNPAGLQPLVNEGQNRL